MPELPEVEVVRRGLQHWVGGRTIVDAEVLHPRAVRRHAAGAEDFAGRLRGARVTSACRRGKYLWLPLGQTGPRREERAAPRPAAPAGGTKAENSPATAVVTAPCSPSPAGAVSGAAPEAALLAHLGMSGQLLVQPGQSPDEKHLRVRITFADAARGELRFVDQRTFGGLSLHPVGTGGLPDAIAHIARDPLDGEFDDDAFSAALRRRRTTVKRALLDQSLISGVGNIYADEALWRAGLHYETPTPGLTRRRAADLLQHVREVMHAALAEGGTSFDSLYVNVNGESGYFERALNVYGREDLPCRRCATPVRRSPWMNRSSYFCPRCQCV